MTVIEAENVAVEIAELGRVETMERIANFCGRFHLDFTHEFLEGKSIDELHHILLAAELNAR